MVVMDEDALIAQYIEENPRQPGPTGARLRDYGTEVWALIGYLRDAVNGDVETAAADYEIPLEALEAARAYYRRHQGPIDGRIAWNAA
jgi:uncharacterized protein (DUF433 family)